MGYQYKRRKMTAEINVVPYIDVMLVLLIIFMVTAPFITQGVDVQLPTSSDAKTAADIADKSGESSFIIVEVSADGHYRISIDGGDKIPVTAQEMALQVKAALSLKPKSNVMVGGDVNTPYQDIIDALNILTQAGVESVGLMTEPAA